MRAATSALLPLLTCICCGYAWLSAAAASDVQFAMFSRCPDGKVHDGTSLYTAWEVSFLKCASTCSLQPECNSLNVCPSAKDGIVTSVQCTMFLDIAGEDCQGLKPDTRSSEEHCFYLERNDRRCQNGGTRYGTRCLCVAGYAGALCDRYIMDCEEAVEYAASRPQDGIFIVQPVGAPRTFHVMCEFWYNLTIVLARDPPCVDFSRGWAEYKTGFGLRDRICDGQVEFFSGLDCLAYMTSQTLYQLHALHEYNHYTSTASAYYNGFRISGEADGYALTYDNFTSRSGVDAKNGFGTGTVRFYTSDHEAPDNCASARGQAGWYDAECEGYSPFGTSPTWTVPTGDVIANKIKYYLMRL